MTWLCSILQRLVTCLSTPVRWGELATLSDSLTLAVENAMIILLIFL